MIKKAKSISIIGLGKLGLPMALCFASHKFNVIGYDVNKSWIKMLQETISPIHEPFVQELLTQNDTKIQFTQNVQEIIEKSNISFIVVPTPSKEDGSFSSKYIEEVVETIAPFIKKKKEKHVIVITSTMSPQTTENVLAPLLEKLTGKKIGSDLGLCYSPELIALGSVVQNITHPDFLFVGESDKETGELVESIRKQICSNKPAVIHTNWINAELIKLSLNAYITTKISFANMIARIAEHTANADSEVILNAIGQDSRIGTKYLKGGLGFGGPCFPRDNKALASFIASVGQNPNMPLSVQSFNMRQTDGLYEVIKKYIQNNNITVGILGLSYKPGTDVVEESPSISLAKKIISKGIKVVAYDPAAMENANKIAPCIEYTHSIQECVEESGVIIITTAWKEFKDFPWKKTIRDSKKTIIDCWRCLDRKKISSESITYISLGSYIP